VVVRVVVPDVGHQRNVGGPGADNAVEALAGAGAGASRPALASVRWGRPSQLPSCTGTRECSGA
jgi:hypothetical protein